MHLMQGNLRTALLGTEPESAEQSQKYIQQQKSHTHYVIAQVIAPCLLEITADVLKGTYFGDKDIADTELFLTVRFQALDEIMVLIFADTDTEFQSRIIPIEFIKKGIRIAGLLEIIVTYILQGRSQPVGLYRIAEKPEALAYEFRQRTAVLPVKVVGSKELSLSNIPASCSGVSPRVP